MRSRSPVAFALVGAIAGLAVPGAAPARQLHRDAIPAVSENKAIPTADRFQGKVLALDREDGGILLATSAGMIAVRSNIDNLADLEVGDTIEVVLLDEE